MREYRSVTIPSAPNPMISIDCLGHKFTDIQAIIFDKDGTLEDSGDYLRSLSQQRARLIDTQVPGIGASLLTAFGVNGLTLDPAGLQSVGSRYENEIAAAAYIAETGLGWSAAIDLARDAFIQVDLLMASTPAAMFPGCQKLIESCAAAGIKLGIVSAATTSQVVKFANYHQLQAHFQVLLGSDLQFAKPDPRLFQFACQEMGVTPDRTLMIGDSSWDMSMGSKGGAAGCIGISWGRTAKPLSMADVSISDLTELKIRI
jgi:phosphoglycolate phosphatase